MYRNQKDFDRWGRFYFDGDGAPSGLPGNANPGGLSEAALAAFNSRLAKLEGNSTALAQILFGENYNLRGELRELKPKIIPDGAVVLTGDDAKSWAEYQALGKPADLKAGLDQRNQFQGELEQSKREASVRKAADAAGYKYSVLAEREELARVRGKALTFDVREVDKDGKKQLVAYVKEGDTERPLVDYAQENWADHLPALQAGPGGSPSTSMTTATSQSSPGIRYPSQHTGGGGGNNGKDLTSEFIEKQNARAAEAPNPLLKR